MDGWEPRENLELGDEERDMLSNCWTGSQMYGIWRKEVEGRMD